MKKNLDTFVKKEDIHWPLWIHDFYFEVSNASANERRYIDFLCAKLSFGYENPYNNKFNPSIIMNGKRSCIYDDLTDEDFETIKRISALIDNRFIAAKIFDILFIKTKNNKYVCTAFLKFKDISNYYIELGKAFLAAPFIKHSLYIALLMGDDVSIASFIDSLLNKEKYKSSHDYAISVNAINSFFEECNYKKYNKKKIITEIETNISDESDDYLFCVNILINYYSSTKNIEKIKFWINKYADLCELLCEKSSPHGYKYISRAIEMFSKDKESNEQRINDLEFVLEAEYQKMFDAMNFQSIPLDDKTNSLINDHLIKVQKLLIEEKDSVRQFGLFLKIFKPVTEKELIDFSNQMDKSIFSNFCNEIIFDKDKRIIEEIGPGEKNKRKNRNFIQGYHLYHSIYEAIAIKYLSCIIIDEPLLSLIKDVVEHNEFVPKSRAEVVFNYLVSGLKKDVRQSVFNLIVQFEYGCSEYLISIKVHPTIPAGSKRKNADLNHFLTIEKFRKPLKDIFGEDLTKELQYLLVDKHYGNLRNQDYHVGSDNAKACTNIEILAFFKLLNAYCMGYNGSIAQ